MKHARWVKHGQIQINSKMLDVLSRGTPEMMKQAKKENADISKTMHCVKLSKT